MSGGGGTKSVDVGEDVVVIVVLSALPRIVGVVPQGRIVGTGSVPPAVVKAPS